MGGLDVVCEKKSGRKEDVVLISVKQQLARKKRVCLRFKTSDVEVVGSHTPFTTTPYMKKKKILVVGFPQILSPRPQNLTPSPKNVTSKNHQKLSPTSRFS